MQIPDHPVIRSMERSGYPDGRQRGWPVCPICGQETDTIWQNNNMEIVGCGECLHSRDAWEVRECFPEN